MQKRKLGTSGLEITPLVFGGNVFGWTVDEPTSFRLLDSFVGAGFNCIDTADIYSAWAPGHKGGESEIIIGKWLKACGRRDNVVILTKLGFSRKDEGGGLTRERILEDVEASLKRLQTDYIDLYQSHVDDKTTPLEETLEAYQQLIKQGKVRSIGASNYLAPRLTAALKTSTEEKLPRYESLQPLYNLADRAGFEKDLQALCLKENIGVIPYSSLAAGFLTGKYREETDCAGAARGARVKNYFDDRGKRILKALDDVAGQLGAKPVHVALAWLAARPAVTAPIASATDLTQLDDLITGVRMKLDDDSTKTLNTESA